MSKTIKLRLCCFVVLLSICVITPLHVVYTKAQKKDNITRRIARHIRYENNRMEKDTARMISRAIYDESEHKKVDYRLVLALMKIESNYDKHAVSSMGARGLLQVKPSVAKHVANEAGVSWVDHSTLDEPHTNIRIGIHIFSKLLNDFKDINKALKAYNMGPTRVRTLPEHKARASAGFSGLVLSEYKKNSSSFPDP